MPVRESVKKLKENRAVSFVLGVNKRYTADGGSYHAGSLAYYGFVSIFPLLLLGLSIVGFVFARDAGARLRWTNAMTSAVPGLSALIGKNVETVMKTRTGTGIIGVVGLLWSGMRIADACEYSLATIFRVERISSAVKRKLETFLIVLGLGAVAVLGVAASAFAGGVEGSGPAIVAFRVVATIVSWGLDFLLFIVAYRLLIPQRGPRFNVLWKGALFAGAGWSFLKVVGAAYAKHAASGATAVYGSFAAVVAILALLFLAARLFLYGAELNAVFIERSGADETPAERSAHKYPVAPQKETYTPASASPTGSELKIEPTHPDGDAHRRTIDLVKDIASDTGTLVRKEIELARTEIVRAVMARAIGIAAIVVGAVVGLLAVVFLGLAAASGLDQVMPVWASRLIVSALFVGVAFGAVLFATAKVKGVPMAPQETKRTIQEDIEWAKERLAK